MKLLIAGASIAGPALAYFLSERGHQVTVVERAPYVRPGGYAVDIRGAALEVIERMGIRERLRPLETDTESNSFLDGRGRELGRMPRGFGVVDPGDIEIHRGDLARVLYELTCARASYRFSEHIQALHDRGSHVEVRFASGARERFDAVVGADGVHSGTRRLVFGEEKSFAQPLGLWMAIFTMPNYMGLKRQQLLFTGTGRIASVKCANEDRELKVALFFAAPAQPFERFDEQAQKAEVARAYADAGWEFPRMLPAMQNAEDFYCDTSCQIHMERHVLGRVALIGDAGFCPSPLSGQGTSLALVSAYVLAHALEASPLDVPPHCCATTTPSARSSAPTRKSYARSRAASCRAAHARSGCAVSACACWATCPLPYSRAG